MTAIVHALAPVTLVGGAALHPGDLDLATAHAPLIVAADGGAQALLEAGRVPQAVIGDMDSITAAARAAFAGRLYPIAEQETTDFDKALRHVVAPLVLAIGVTGGRFDHELAVMHVLVRLPERPCVVIGPESLVFVCPPDMTLDLPPGSVFSLFPMGRVRVESQGLRWPTAGLDFAPDRKIGTSNEVTGLVTLCADAPAMLVILPREALAAVVRAFVPVAQAALKAPARWPARAG